VRIGDPGGELLRGYDPATPPSAWPLTVAGEGAARGQDGMSLNGYRNYLGQRVVGTWRWFPRAGVGIVVEQGYDESYEGVRILWQAFGTLFGIIVVGTGLIWLGFGMLERAQARARRAEQLGQYTLERIIGEGAMGTVYRARHAFLRRPTAVKLLRAERSTPQAVRRFEKEVQATSQLVHPNTITVFDYGRTPVGTFYYAMEYLSGLTLDVVVQRFGPLPERRVAHILRQVCGSLAEAHAAGLIHRDVKPQNLMLCHRGGVPDLVKVLDFGLVKESDTPDPDLTRDGAAVGTPLYMAPEAASASGEIDARADLYSVGVVTYFLLTGVQPFFGVNAREVMRRHMEERPRAPSEQLGQPLNPELEGLVLMLLAKDPGSRPPTAQAVEELLDQVIEPMIGRWTDEEGDAWWRANAPELIGTRAEAEPDVAPLTLDVDVASRAGRV
jgi:serine/threonine protein kinase